MEISKTDLIGEGSRKQIVNDVLSIIFVAAGLFAAFAWSLGPDIGPEFLETQLFQGTVMLLLSLTLMVAASD